MHNPPSSPAGNYGGLEVVAHIRSGLLGAPGGDRTALNARTRRSRPQRQSQCCRDRSGISRGRVVLAEAAITAWRSSSKGLVAVTRTCSRPWSLGTGTLAGARGACDELLLKVLGGSELMPATSLAGPGCTAVAPTPPRPSQGQSAFTRDAPPGELLQHLLQRGEPSSVEECSVMACRRRGRATSRYP